MADAGSWCLIESDPGVFSELIADLGVRGVQVEELYSLDEASLAQLRPVHGLVFLFKWTGEKDARPCEPDYGTVFFARQVITNACATQAILSVLLNRETLDLGDELRSFREFTAEFDAETRGLAISNSEKIRSVHNSFARAEALSFEDSGRGKKEDAFHFIAYLPIRGHLYELDGLKPGPINLGPCTEDDWLAKVTPVIEARMARYQQEAASEIRFNLMALVKDRALVAEEGLAAVAARLDQVDSKLAAAADSKMRSHDDLPASADELRSLQFQLQEERASLVSTLSLEQAKRARYAKENERRRHNFIPLFIELLTVLAEKGALAALADKSKPKPDAKSKTGSGSS